MVYIGLSLKVSIKESIYTSGRVAFLQCLTSVIHCSSVYSIMWQRATLYSQFVSKKVMIFQSSSNVYRDFYRKKKRKRLILEMHF